MTAEKDGKKIVTIEAIHLDGIGLVFPIEEIIKNFQLSLETLRRYHNSGVLKNKKFGKTKYITQKAMADFFGVPIKPGEKELLFQGKATLDGDLKKIRNQAEKEKIIAALKKHLNKQRAAQSLGMAPSTLNRKIEKHGIDIKNLD